VLAKQAGGGVLIGSERMTASSEGSCLEPEDVLPGVLCSAFRRRGGTLHTTAFKTSRKGLRMRADGLSGNAAGCGNRGSAAGA
jgi:hypothetical protein